MCVSLVSMIFKLTRMSLFWHTFTFNAKLPIIILDVYNNLRNIVLPSHVLLSTNTIVYIVLTSHVLLSTNTIVYIVFLLTLNLHSMHKTYKYVLWPINQEVLSHVFFYCVILHVSICFPRWFMTYFQQTWTVFPVDIRSVRVIMWYIVIANTQMFLWRYNVL